MKGVVKNVRAIHTSPRVYGIWASRKTQLKRAEWMADTYPNCPTEEPKQLPRRGRRGGWMQNPARGPAYLDGTNDARDSILSEQLHEVDNEFTKRVLEAKQSGQGLNEVLEQHMFSREEVRLATPQASAFVQAKIKKLTETERNPVYDGEKKPRKPPIMEIPSFVQQSERHGRITDGKASTKVFSPIPSHLQEPPEEQGSSSSYSGEAKEEVVESPNKIFNDRLDIHRKVLDKGKAKVEAIKAGTDPGVPKPGSSGEHEAEMFHGNVEDELNDFVAGIQGRGRKSGRSPAERRECAERRVALTKSERDEIAIEKEMEGSNPFGQDVPEEEMDPVLKARSTPLGEFWADHFNPKFVQLNECIIPASFHQTGALKEYWQTRNACGLFDLSYKRGFLLRGRDRQTLGEHFLSCPLRKMEVGDVQYALVLDSKGLILDDGFVLMQSDHIHVMISGFEFPGLLDYIANYIMYGRQSDLDVTITPWDGAVLSLQGPDSASVLSDMLESNKLMLSNPSHEIFGGPAHINAKDIQSMPMFSACPIDNDNTDEIMTERAFMSRIGITGLDGFEFWFPNSLSREVVQLAKDLTERVKPSGIWAKDMLRLEAGMPRGGVDITPKVTPVHAALVWALDQKKMRDHQMFGWRRLFVQLAHGPQFRRVGLIMAGYAHGGCVVVSNPHRRHIGQISSAAWSPQFNRRIAMAYIKPEYARHGKHVMVSVPFDVTRSGKLRCKPKTFFSLIRQGMHRAYFRKLICARVVQFPFVPHSYGSESDRFKSLPLGKGQQHTDFVDQMAGIPIPIDNQQLSEQDKRASMKARNLRRQQLKSMADDKSKLFLARAARERRAVGRQALGVEGEDDEN